MSGVFPDYPAPVVRDTGAEREMVLMRWGMPPPPARQIDELRCFLVEPKTKGESR